MRCFKIYKCICGKEFENKQAYCGHSGNCIIKHPNRIFKNNHDKNFIPWNKGLNKYSNKIIMQISKNISKSLTGKTKRNHSEETKLKISKSCKINAGGYRPGSGFGKQGWYKNYWCDSSYELAFVIYNLEHNIKFERNYDSFNYIYIYKNNKHKYIPDFKLNNQYIEIKGFERPNDKYKYKSCPNLKVLYYNDLKYCFDYVINKYGKDYIKLYE